MKQSTFAGNGNGWRGSWRWWRILIQPIFVEQVAEAQVADAGGAQPTDPHDRRDVRAHREQRLRQIASALEWCTVMWRAEEHEALHRREPTVPGAPPVLACSARDQTAHAVTEQHELRDRVLREELLERIGEIAAIVRDVAAGVVRRVDRREPVRGECFAMIETVAAPALVAHAQAVNQDHDARPGLAVQLHRHREWIVRRLEMIADHAVERGEDRGTTLRGLGRGQQQIDAAADHAGHAADRLIHRAA